MSDYSIWVCEYAYARNHAKSSVVYGAHNQGHVKLPYCYVVIKGRGHIAMVDVGYSERDHGRLLSEKYGIENWRDPKIVLSEIGIGPEQVDTCFITHAHFDHFGNADDFPNARFYIQEREISKWVWAMSLPDRMRWMMSAVDPGDIVRGVDLAREKRLATVNGSLADVLPGIDLHAAPDTHTWGSMWVTVRNDGQAPSADSWVLAGDLIYQFENVRGSGAAVGVEEMYVPIGFAVGSQSNLVLATEEMMSQVGYDARRVIPVHEEGLKDVFPSRITTEGLRVTEICLADGELSKVVA